MNKLTRFSSITWGEKWEETRPKAPGTTFVREDTKIAVIIVVSKCTAAIGSVAANVAPCIATALGMELPCYASD